VRYIGIDIGGTEIKAGLVDREGAILAWSRRPTNRREPELLLARLLELVDSVSGGSEVRAIGVGVPGLISVRSGRVEMAPNMPALNGLNISEMLAGPTGLPTIAANDADMNAWGEFGAGAARGSRHVVCLTIGTGLGSGLILDGRLWAGTSGFGAEAGHMVLDPEGLPCGCGSRGCLETIVSATGIVSLARRGIAAGATTCLSDDSGLTARTIQEAAAGGDAFAASVYARVGRSLGMACASLINLLNPEIIVIGGGVAAAGDYLIGPATEETRIRTYRQTFEACRIVPAQLGSHAGVVGAGLFASQHFAATVSGA
jgi:glucokinase